MAMQLVNVIPFGLQIYSINFLAFVRNPHTCVHIEAPRLQKELPNYVKKFFSFRLVWLLLY